MVNERRHIGPPGWPSSTVSMVDRAVDLSPRLAIKLPSMTANPHAGRRALHFAPAACFLLALTACMADGGQSLTPQRLAGAPGESRLVTYRCDADATIAVRAEAGAVHLVDTEGASYDLPASPPTQANRFGEGSVALVIEQGEALWMKAGREPVTCRQ